MYVTPIAPNSIFGTVELSYAFIAVVGANKKAKAAAHAKMSAITVTHNFRAVRLLNPINSILLDKKYNTRVKY